MAPLSGGPVPMAARRLTAAGAIPFLVGAILVWISPPPDRESLLAALVAYGAIILSFLGGCHWAFVSRGDDGEMPRAGATGYALSVVPALIGWLAFALPPAGAFLLLAAAFAGMYAVDVRASGRGLTPRWWLSLRRPVTIVVVLSLLIAAVGILVPYASLTS